jgi:hypothetical protein
MPLMVVGALLAATVALSSTAKAAGESSFVSFDAFIADVSKAPASGVAEGRAGAVRSSQAFDEMRSYVLNTYRGVKVDHSYLADGSYFDCVETKSQPSVQALNTSDIATPPAAGTGGIKSEAGAQSAASPLTLGLKDSYGNSVSCPLGTVPIQRISLDRLTKFATVQDFLVKGPPGGTEKSDIQPAAATPSRQYAHGYQNVTNHGGNSYLNLWNPEANFSISQQWYTTGSYSADNLQTLEGGWIKYPDKFGSRSVLFIFFTPDTYKTGCYNLDCTGFVQTSSNWALGGAFSAYSSVGGQQYGFAMQWKYFEGNWWLFLGGAGNLEAVGYYPGSVYKGGALARSATSIDFGGEVAPKADGTWPAMGSGHFASAGSGQAAYQSTIFYTATDESGVWASLTTSQTAPTCYTILYTPASSGSDSGTYFYFGGPGGVSC